LTEANGPAGAESPLPESIVSGIDVPVQRSAALENVSEKEQVTPEGAPSHHGELVANPTLTHFLTFHPLTTFFCWLADKQYPASHQPDTRVSRLRASSPWFYWTCVLIDVVITVAVTILLVGTATAVAWKTVH
jgi:hypothetical protein